MLYWRYSKKLQPSGMTWRFAAALHQAYQSSLRTVWNHQQMVSAHGLGNHDAIAKQVKESLTRIESYRGYGAYL
jgi:hypothetical protein